jgi:hypothetical protein
MRRLFWAGTLICLFAATALAGDPEQPPVTTSVIDALLKLIGLG